MINKFIYNKLYRLCILIVIVTIFTGIGWSGYSNTTITWIIDFILLFTLFQYKKRYKAIQIINIYFIWLIFETLRGIFIAENYWEWKQLITGFLSLSIPIFVFPFQSCNNTQVVLTFWAKYAIPLFLIFIFTIPSGAYHFYLGPVFLFGCFFPILPKKWKIIIGILLLLMIFKNLDARSQVIKTAVTILIAIGVYFAKFIHNFVLKIIHFVCYIVPIILLYLGLSGEFNVFQDLSKYEGKYTQTKIVDGEIIESDLSADTRTFIYEETITSALKHNYVILGRTPARGNDSAFFGEYLGDVLKTGKYERHSNEICHTNVFTWLGLIGIILYSLIYIQSSYLAVYKSNNLYIKLVGCFIAFRWAYGWIEDINRFDIMNISLWMIIAMGFSTQFRQMNNTEFKFWFKNIFNKI